KSAKVIKRQENTCTDKNIVSKRQNRMFIKQRACFESERALFLGTYDIRRRKDVSIPGRMGITINKKEVKTCLLY
ncbi:MAG TPA: hypothetical protein DD663_07155, partial [Exiguobacterium sp.]|nr:hypothetical protein [Exiguobacterium sp.]